MNNWGGKNGILATAFWWSCSMMKWWMSWLAGGTEVVQQKNEYKEKKVMMGRVELVQCCTTFPKNWWKEWREVSCNSRVWMLWPRTSFLTLLCTHPHSSWLGDTDPKIPVHAHRHFQLPLAWESGTWSSSMWGFFGGCASKLKSQLPRGGFSLSTDIWIVL